MLAWLILVSVVLLLCAIRYYLSRRELSNFAANLPGPTAIPILGNALEFFCDNNLILEKLLNIFNGYKHPMKFWLGPKLMVVFSSPDHIQTIVSSSKLTYKDDVYDLLKPYVGDGLISASGAIWKKYRRIVTPLFNKKFVESSLTQFPKRVNILLQQLDDHVDKGTFDVLHYLHYCFADFFGDCILGYEINSQKGENRDFVITLGIEAHVISHARITKVWLQPDFLFRLTPTGSYHKKCLKISQTFYEKVITAARKRHLQPHDDNNQPVIDELLDLFRKNGEAVSDADLFSQFSTLYLASEDTTSTISAFALMILGMYPDVQNKIVDELTTVLEGKKPEQITPADVYQLNYLEMCIKEILRLFPIAPVLLRKVNENVTIDKMKVPAGCTIAIAIWSLHRSPENWEKPNEFYPEHFTSENISKRSPYAFIPFSSGLRGCIGQFYAYQTMKFALACILQRYIIESDEKLEDIKLKTDISIRSINGYKIKLRRRPIEHINS